MEAGGVSIEVRYAAEICGMRPPCEERVFESPRFLSVEVSRFGGIQAAATALARRLSVQTGGM